MTEDLYSSLSIYDDAQKRTPSFVANRAEYICSLALGRSVLHVGCGDWPVTAHKLQSGTLLHASLAKAARSLTGVDLELRAIHCLREAGFADCIVCDAEHLDLDRRFECVVAGDVLEHVNNAGAVVAALARHLTADGLLVIAVPSALSIGGLRALLNRSENVHRDHTAYYSPKTLSALCSRYGLLPTSLVFTVQPPAEGDSIPYVKLRDALLQWRPGFAPSFVMTLRQAGVVDRSSSWTWR